MITSRICKTETAFPFRIYRIKGRLQKLKMQLQKIYVLKDFLSMRIGFELQDSLLKKAKDYWLSVLNSNERGILPKKPGLKKFGEHDFQILKKISNLLAIYLLSQRRIFEYFIRIGRIDYNFGLQFTILFRQQKIVVDDINETPYWKIFLNCTL